MALLQPWPMTLWRQLNQQQQHLHLQRCRQQEALVRAAVVTCSSSS